MIIHDRIRFCLHKRYIQLCHSQTEMMNVGFLVYCFRYAESPPTKLQKRLLAGVRPSRAHHDSAQRNLGTSNGNWITQHEKYKNTHRNNIHFTMITDGSRSCISEMLHTPALKVLIVQVETICCPICLSV